MKSSGDQIVSDLQELELIAQVSNEAALRAHLAEQPRTVYCGFDPTADSLHIGNLVPLLALRRFQNYGHQPILLVGGATGLIGDPGGRASERTLKPRDEVAAFVDKIREQACRFLDFECEDKPALVVDNANWVNGLDVITYLRDIGKHFSVNAMVQKETVKRRLEDDSAGISYTEFSYMILQSYDFAVLYRDQHCTIQMGGSDQWGNIVSGLDLNRRQNKAQCFALTVPLITKADGTKFGKTEAGAVWLDAGKTSPYSFYQFWLSVADADVYKFLHYFTFIATTEIAAIEATDAAAEGRPQGQAILASEATRLVHGEAGLKAALRITEALFSGDSNALSEQDFQQLRQDGLPSSLLADEDVLESPLTNLLTECGMAKAGREVKDALGRNSVFVNGQPKGAEDIMNSAAIFAPEQALYGRFFLVRLGKKKYHIFERV